jgi:hypothetical protein
MEELPEDKNEAVPRKGIYMSNIPHESQYIFQINTLIKNKCHNNILNIHDISQRDIWLPTPCRLYLRSCIEVTRRRLMVI